MTPANEAIVKTLYGKIKELRYDVDIAIENIKKCNASRGNIGDRAEKERYLQTQRSTIRRLNNQLEKVLDVIQTIRSEKFTGVCTGCSASLVVKRITECFSLLCPTCAQKMETKNNHIC